MSKNPVLKIRQLRELKGFSQEYMAQKLAMSQRSFSKLERQQTRIDWSRIAEIAAIFEMNPIDLIAFDDDLVFNASSPNNGTVSVYSRLSDKLIEQYEKHIKSLEDEIRFLRGQLNHSVRKTE
ncbi:MAG: helix-turn-helix transcriptional regulator [Bacteroidetes bacterium]|nr:helix-turn-helix transcriptional regulator [Bacteroidota bacterium]